MAFDIDQVQDYVEGLCRRHKDVRHNIDGIKSFARFQREEEVSELRNNPGPNVVIVASLNGRRVGDKDDRTIERVMVLRFASYSQDNSPASIGAAIKKAEVIMLDFIAEMERKQEADIDADEACGIMHYFRPENVSWDEIEDQPWLVNHYGFDCSFPFCTFMPGHNENKWEAEGS